MYRNYEYNSEPLAQGSGQPSVPQRRRPKRPSCFQRVVTLVLCAALFGGVAGGSFYGVNCLLGYLESDSSDSGNSLTSSVSLTSLSYSSGDSSLDITDIAAQGLTDPSFSYHLESAKKNGVTKNEIAEIDVRLKDIENNQ